MGRVEPADRKPPLKRESGVRPAVRVDQCELDRAVATRAAEETRALMAQWESKPANDQRKNQPRR